MYPYCTDSNPNVPFVRKTVFRSFFSSSKYKRLYLVDPERNIRCKHMNFKFCRHWSRNNRFSDGAAECSTTAAGSYVSLAFHITPGQVDHSLRKQPQLWDDAPFHPSSYSNYFSCAWPCLLIKWSLWCMTFPNPNTLLLANRGGCLPLLYVNFVWIIRFLNIIGGLTPPPPSLVVMLWINMSQQVPKPKVSFIKLQRSIYCNLI